MVAVSWDVLTNNGVSTVKMALIETLAHKANISELRIPESQVYVSLHSLWASTRRPYDLS